ncbi:hypothetical protein [Actinoplanes sp. NPDC049802]|uniref:hypothetical protein n=1 Tax=Actinoplanes sp. NPDC049802 TaxID=3154742 RepID=UPI0033DF3D43
MLPAHGDVPACGFAGAFARIVDVLELENHQLRTGTGRTGRFVALTAARER